MRECVRNRLAQAGAEGFANPVARPARGPQELDNSDCAEQNQDHHKDQNHLVAAQTEDAGHRFSKRRSFHEGEASSEVLQIQMTIAPQIQRAGSERENDRHPKGDPGQHRHPRFEQVRRLPPFNETVGHQQRDDRHDL